VKVKRCLRPGHLSNKYRSQVMWLLCGKRHALVLCKKLPVHKESQRDKSEEEKNLVGEADVLGYPWSTSMCRLAAGHSRQSGRSREKIVPLHK
jgi:hypothetical protein